MAIHTEIESSSHTPAEAESQLQTRIDDLETEVITVYQHRQAETPTDKTLEGIIPGPITEAEIEKQEVMRIWQNYKNSVNLAAYVLGSLRRNASDVHGMSECSAALVRHAIDCGTFIIRSITSEMNADAQQLDALDF